MLHLLVGAIRKESELTLKKEFPWLARRASDLGLFLLYSAYIPNWSFYKRGRQKQRPSEFWCRLGRNQVSLGTQVAQTTRKTRLKEPA